jgi:hypothetical protein
LQRSRAARACAAFSASSTVWPSSVEDLGQQVADAELVVHYQDGCHMGRGDVSEEAGRHEDRTTGRWAAVQRK